MRRLFLACSILCILFITATGCSSGGDVENPVPIAPAEIPQSGTIVVKVDLTQPRELPDSARGFLDAATITVHVLSPLDGSEIIPATVVTATPGVASQEIPLTDLPLGPVRILVTAEDAGGNSLGTAEQDAEVGPLPSTLLFSELYDPGPTRELGLLSTSANGTQGNGASLSPSISQDGRFVAFSSSASNLVTGDTNGLADIFLRDRTLGTISRVSLGVAQTSQANNFAHPAISPNGQQVAFQRVGDGSIFLRELAALRTTQVNTGTVAGLTVGPGSEPQVSDTREVVFSTGTAPARKQVVLKNVPTASLELISVSTTGGSANADCDNPGLSGDGRFVVFRSLAASNLVAATVPFTGQGQIYLRDRVLGTTTHLALTGDFVGMSANARFIATSSTNPGAPGLFVLDRNTGIVTTATTQPMDGRPGVSNDGQVVCNSFVPLVADDINGLSDCYHWHPVAGFSRVNVAADGFAVQGGLKILTAREGPEISADGKRVTFASADALLVPRDNNGFVDVFSAATPRVGKLYLSLGNTIQRYDALTILTGTPGPTAVISGSNTRLNNPAKMTLDATHDRLYVVNEGPPGEILVFDNISTLTGNVTPARHLGNPQQQLGRAKDMVVDVSRDILYLLIQAQPNAIGKISTPEATNAVNDLRFVHITSNAINNELQSLSLLLDERRNELYVGGRKKSSGVPIVAVFGPVSLLVEQQASRRELTSAELGVPGRSITGLAFDSSPIGSAPNPPDPKLAGPNASLLVTLNDRLGTFPNGSATGVLGNLTPTNSIQGGGINPAHQFEGLFVDRYTGQTYVFDATAGAFLVFSKANLSGAVAADRTIQLNAIPRGFAMDRTH